MEIFAYYKMSDTLASLPVDEEPVSNDEQQILDKIMQQDQNKLSKLIQLFKLPGIAGLLFFTLHTQWFTQMTRTSLPYAASSEFSMLVFKTGLFVVALFVYIHM